MKDVLDDSAPDFQCPADRFVRDEIVDPVLLSRMTMRRYRCPNGVSGIIGVTLCSYRGEPGVVLSELRDNPGVSVTNACDTYAMHAWAELAHLFDRPVSQIVWIEHYSGSTSGDPALVEHFDRIRFDGIEQGRFGQPTWSRIDPRDLEFLPLKSTPGASKSRQKP
jgi:hypothetical protein